MNADIRPALVSLAFFSALTGIAYPMVVTGIATTVFPSQSHGSMLTHGDTTRGSALVGQSFTKPGYLWGRPSALAIPYDARGSGASNLGPTNPTLDSLVKARIATLRAADPTATGAVPVELVTSSGSGLDPHVSPAAALYQVNRIASARHIEVASVRRIIEQLIEPRTFGILGEARVNVLEVNLQLDAFMSPTAVPHK